MLKKIRSLCYSMGFLFFRPFTYIIPFKISLKFFYTFRSIIYLFLSNRKKKAYENLTLLLPNFKKSELKKIMDRLLWSVFIYPFVDIYLDKIVEETKNMVEIYNLEKVKKLLSEDKPLILLFFHNGLHNICFPHTGLIRPVHIVVAFLYDKPDIFTKMQNKCRLGMHKKLKQLKWIYLKKDALVQLKIVKLLKENKIVAISADGTYSTKYFEIPFFNNYKILVPTGAFRISSSLNIPIVPMYSYFDHEEFKIKIIYGDIIKGKDSYEMAKIYWKDFVSFLKEHPDAWTGWWRLYLDENNFLRLKAI